MKFTYYDQTMDLFAKEYFPDGPPQKIVISCSGGLDSSGLLYLACKYFPEVEKHIFTGHNPKGPFESLNAQDVVSWIEDNIPNHNIQSHDILEYDDTSDEILAEAKQLVDNDPSYFDKYPWIDRGNEKDSWKHFLEKIAKPISNTKNIRSIMRKYECKRYIAAMTQNPPNDVMEKLGFAHLAETKRNEDQNTVHVFNRDGISYHPFARVNKLFVKGIYETHDLMGEYYNLTGSCTGNYDLTNYFTKPCGKCFWCHEKKWAFGEC